MKKISLGLLVILVSFGAFFAVKAATPDTDIVDRLYNQIVNGNVIKRMTCTNKGQLISSIIASVRLNLITADKDTRIANIKSLLQSKLQDYANTKCSQKQGSSSASSSSTKGSTTITTHLTCDPSKATTADYKKLNNLIRAGKIGPDSTIGNIQLVKDSKGNIGKLAIDPRGGFVTRPNGGGNSVSVHIECSCSSVGNGACTETYDPATEKISCEKDNCSQCGMDVD